MTLNLDQRARPKLTAYDRQSIIAMRKMGASWAMIQESVHVGHDTVYRVLKQAGLTRTHRAPGTVPVKPRCRECGQTIKASRR